MYEVIIPYPSPNFESSNWVTLRENLKNQVVDFLREIDPDIKFGYMKYNHESIMVFSFEDETVATMVKVKFR